MQCTRLHEIAVSPVWLAAGFRASTVSERIVETLFAREKSDSHASRGEMNET